MDEATARNDVDRTWEFSDLGVTMTDNAAELRRLRAIEAAARRYQSAEWAHRLNEDEPRMTPEHNARVEEWRAADRELRSLLMTSEVPSDAR